MTYLRSGIYKTFESHFVLDEDALRRIEAIVRKASEKIPDPQIEFRVNREDDRFFETHSIDDVLQDPNVPRKRVKYVKISLDSKQDSENPPDEDGEIITIEFSKKERWMPPVELNVSYHDRSWALLTADELEPQIRRLFRRTGISRWIFAVFLLPAGLIAYNLIETKTVSVTLNSWTLLALILSSIAVVGMVIGWFQRLSESKYEEKPGLLQRLLGPESVFLWGEEVRAFETRERNRRQFFWSVVVAFVISFAASGLWIWLV